MSLAKSNRKEDIIVNWNILSKYRKELMGLATIAVVIFHFFEMVGKNIEEVDIITRFLYNIGRYGYMGVEVFLLLSGMGCYYSLKRKNDIKLFIKKRLKKVLVPYFLFSVPFWFYIDVFIDKYETKFILDIFNITFFKGNRLYWYVVLIVAMYFIVPVLFYLFDKDNKVRKVSFYCLEFLVLIFSVILFIRYNSYFKVLQVALTRVPSFIFGVYIGKNIYEKKNISPLMLFITVFSLFFIDYKFPNVLLMRYANFIQAIGLSLLVAQFMDIVNANRIRKGLCFIGAYSLEIYLGHVTFRKLFNYYGLSTYKIEVYFIVVLLTIVSVFVVNNITNLIDKRIKI